MRRPELDKISRWARYSLAPSILPTLLVVVSLLDLDRPITLAAVLGNGGLLPVIAALSLSLYGDLSRAMGDLRDDHHSNYAPDHSVGLLRSLRVSGWLAIGVGAVAMGWFIDVNAHMVDGVPIDTGFVAVGSLVLLGLHVLHAVMSLILSVRAAHGGRRRPMPHHRGPGSEHRSDNSINRRWR